MFSHLDQTSLVNKGFIIWPKDQRTFTEFRFEKNTCYVVTMLSQRCDTVATMLRPALFSKREV